MQIMNRIQILKPGCIHTFFIPALCAGILCCLPVHADSQYNGDKEKIEYAVARGPAVDMDGSAGVSGTAVPGAVLVSTAGDSVYVVIRDESGKALLFDGFVYDTAVGYKDIPGAKDSQVAIPAVQRAGRTASRTMYRILTGPIARQVSQNNFSIEIHGSDITEMSNNDDYEHMAAVTAASRNGAGQRHLHNLSQFRERVKIYVAEEGVYEITGDDLKQAGWDCSSINPQYLRLFNAGHEVPLCIESGVRDKMRAEDRIIFFGESVLQKDREYKRNLSMYSSTNVYILEQSESPGLRYAQEQGYVRQERMSPFSSPCCVVKDDNRQLVHLRNAVYADPEDHYVFSSSIYGGVNWSWSVTLPDPDLWSTRYVSLKMGIRGDASDYNKQYPVDVYLNRYRIATGFWNGSELSVIQGSEFSPTHLYEDTPNTLMVINRAEDGELAPMYIDWFEITYPRLFRAQDDYLRFRVPENSAGSSVNYTIENFTDPDILLFKKDVSRLVGTAVKSVTDSLGNRTFSLCFEDSTASGNTEYIAVSMPSISSPDSMAAIETPVSLLSSNRGEHIIIVPADTFLTEAERLVQHRNTMGRSSAAVMLDDIYNEFGYGIPGAEPVRAFLQWAFETWRPQPRTVLLLGSGTFVGTLEPYADKNLIPVPLYHSTKFGVCAADHFYALLQGNDIIPDIGVGRFPVVSVLELERVVTKTIAFDNAPKQPWQNKYCIIAAGGHGNVFLQQSEEFITRGINPGLSPKRLYLTDAMGDKYLGSTDDLISVINNGVSYINYRGHGGGAVWADNGMFTLEDVPLLRNTGRYPFISSMTCFTADFSRQRTCLGQSLLLKEDGGAAAFWGASGVGWVWNDYYMLNSLYSAFRKHPEACIGQLIMEAKADFLSSYSGSIPSSNAYQYMLLGDPSITLALPYDTADVHIANRAVSDSVRISGKGSNGETSVRISIAGSDLETIENSDLEFQGGPWEYTAPIPGTMKASETEGGVRVWQYSGAGTLPRRAYIPISLTPSFFDSVQTLPERIEGERPFNISVIAQAQEAIDTVWCSTGVDTEDSCLMYMEGENRYVSSRKTGPYAAGTDVKTRFSLVTESGNRYSSGDFIIHVPEKPDLRIYKAELCGEETVKIHAVVANEGESSADSVHIAFQCPTLEYICTDTVSVAPGETADAYVSFSPGLGRNDISVSADPDSLIDEGSENNNGYFRDIVSAVFNVTPENGSMNHAENDTVGVTGMGEFYVEPGAVQNNTTCSVSAVLLDQHPELRVIEFSAGTDENMYATIMLPADSSAGKAAGIYRWSRDTAQWTVCQGSSMKNGMVYARAYLPGKFTVMEYSDHQAPSVEIQVKGQPFTSGSYIPEKPELSILLEDSSGIDCRGGNIELFLDDEPVDRARIIYPDSVRNPLSLHVAYRPELSQGEHTLRVKARDIHGNQIYTEPVSMTVASEFSVRFLGNFPNPFSPYRGTTVFAYTLTAPADRAVLRIFTVSGHLVMRFEDPFMCGADYHEIGWDGRNMEGDICANGVYFFTLEAESGDNKVLVRGKIAIIQ